EMGVRSDLSPGHGGNGWGCVCIIEVAKVHVIRLNSPGPTWHPLQPSLRTVAQRPTGVDVRMTDGMGNRERICRTDSRAHRSAECAGSVRLDLAIGQPPGHIAKHIPISPHITSAQTHCAEPIYLCAVIQNP